MANRILFVDDEPGIRETLAQILTLHGFEVTCCATVSDALAATASREFDVLISDLNVGEPGDGFTVVSAMRRTQPRCITLILTGYPAFESALRAIRNQVDDIIVKPANVKGILRIIEEKLRSPAELPERPLATKRISELIRENILLIVERTLAHIKADPQLQLLSLTDDQYVFPFAPLLSELAAMLASDQPDRTSPEALQFAAMRGRIRRLQGYSIPLIVSSLRLLENTAFEVIQENLLTLDISNLIPDMRRLSNSLALQLQATTQAFLEMGERELLFESSDHWTGWYCARCCWNRPQPASVAEGEALASHVHTDFLAHDCEAFARGHWKMCA